MDKLWHQFHAMNNEMAAIRQTLAANKETLCSTGSKQIQDPAPGQQGEGLKDLAQLAGPLTEHSIIRQLQQRFSSQQFLTHVGPVLLAMNPFHGGYVPGHLMDNARNPQLRHLCLDVVQALVDTRQSQTIVLIGDSGSGKTNMCLATLRELFELVGDGGSTDTFKHVSASLTVLHPLCTAATADNPSASKVGLYIENVISQRVICRTRLHYILSDYTRITKLPLSEGNYNIFYDLLAGLTKEERVKFHLEGHTTKTLAYLAQSDHDVVVSARKNRFNDWKIALSQLGIPFADVLRILSAILLLGNIHFIPGQGPEPDVDQPNNELKSVSGLLGVSAVVLYQQLTTMATGSSGQRSKVTINPTQANRNRDRLAQTLYTRMVSAVFKKINRWRQTVTDSDSDSGSIPRTGSQEYTVGVLDMFGFQQKQESGMWELCMNLCAETIQQYYTLQVLKGPLDAAEEEGIQQNLCISIPDAVPVINLISSQRNGILKLLETESTLADGSPGHLVETISKEHNQHSRMFTPTKNGGEQFGIRHYGGPVMYNAHSLLAANRDQLSDNLVWLFSRQNCNFGFASHLFSQELQCIQDGPRGNKYSITAAQYVPHPSPGHTPCAAQEFYDRLDQMLKIVVQTKPHFIQCLRANDESVPDMFDKEAVAEQLRPLLVLETVYLMAAGLPHKLVYRDFNMKYSVLLKLKPPQQANSTVDQTKAILDQLLREMDETGEAYTSMHWGLGRRYVFLSESCHQQLELTCRRRRDKAATVIQAHWKKRVHMRKWPTLKKQLELWQRQSMSRDNTFRSHSTRMKLKPDKQLAESSEDILIQCPPIPPAREYTIQGNMKVSFPQTRLMLRDFLSPGNEDPGNHLHKGQEVTVKGPSSKRGFLLIEGSTITLHVPYQYTRLKMSSLVPVQGVDS